MRGSSLMKLGQNLGDYEQNGLSPFYSKLSSAVSPFFNSAHSKTSSTSEVVRVGISAYLKRMLQLG